MNSIPSLSQILEIENDSAFAEIVCPSTGILAWPTIRNAFFRLIMSDLLYATNPIISTRRRTPLYKVAWKTFRGISHNINNIPKQCPVLIHATGAGILETEGRSFNRYTGYFTNYFNGQTWSVEGIPWNDWPHPRINGGMSFSYPALAFSILLSYATVRTIHKKLASELVNIAAERTKSLLDWDIEPSRKSWLVTTCSRLLAAYPTRKVYFSRLISKVRPKLCLVDLGCYGEMAVFNSTARENGIAVAEFQHGAVYPGHDTYNVAPLLAASNRYKNTMPDFFLGYGKWWNSQFNAPVKKIVIGNPHREFLLEKFIPLPNQCRTVLIIGDGIETVRYIDLCRELSEVLPKEYRVIFRPHPMERDVVTSLGSSKRKGFDIDLNKDIYPILSNLYAVISELSTASFEAVGLAERIFLWRTEKSRFAFPNNPFADLLEINDIVSKLDDPSAGKLCVHEVQDIWAVNWGKNFEAFLDGLFNS